MWLRSLFAIYDSAQLQALDLPWWTFGAIDALKQLIAERGSLRVFEYGAGASTVWLARRGCKISSVEHDAQWYATFIDAVRQFAHVEVRLIEPGPAGDDVQYRSERPGWQDYSFKTYVKSIDDLDGQFDLIVIDGRARTQCLQEAKRRLAPNGVIVFDNAGRKRYRSALEDPAFKMVMHRGLAVSLPYPDATALIYRA